MYSLKHFLLRFSFAVAGPLLLSGCVSLPPEVKESVDETRQLAGELHKVHAQDARAFALLVEEREHYLQQCDAALRCALRAMAEAQVAAAKAKTMAEFDRRAGDVLGIEFQDRLKRNIMPQFGTIEHSALVGLIDARTQQKFLTNDPAISQKLKAKHRDLLNAQYERENAISAYFLALDASLRSARFRFETEVEAQYNDALKAFLEQIQAATAADAALAAFERRMDTKMAQLDDAYYAVDHSLSDLSTFLDSEATSRRFIKHTAKGVATALIDDVNNGQLGGKAFSDLLAKQNLNFTKEIQQLQSSLQSKAQTAVKDAVGPVTPPAPSLTDLRVTK